MIVFAIYLGMIGYFMFFDAELGRKEGGEGYHYNLVLFREILRFVKYYDVVGMRSAFLNVICNILVFVPFGMLIPAIFRNHLMRFWKVLLISMLFSIGIETIQLFSRVGIFDVDDIFLHFSLYWN